MKRRKWGCLVPLIFLMIACVIIAAAMYVLRIPESYQALRLLEQGLERKNQAGTITFAPDGSEAAMEADFYWCDLADERYACLSASGMELYYHDEGLYFDNGRGYDLSPLLEGIMDLEPEALLLAGFQQEKTEMENRYVLRIESDGLRMLERFSGEAAAALAPYEGSSLTLASEDDVLKRIELDIPDQFSAQIMLYDNTERTIPTDVLMGMQKEKLLSVQTVTPLIEACVSIVQQEVFGADATLNVECGPLPIQDSAQVYGKLDKLYFVRGDSVYELGDGTNSSGLFLALAWEMCRSGMVSTENGSSVYTMSVDGGVLESVFSAVLPEVEGLGIHYEEGMLTVSVNDGFQNMNLSGSGSMPFLIATIPITVDVELRMMDGAIRLPDGIV